MSSFLSLWVRCYVLVPLTEDSSWEWLGSLCLTLPWQGTSFTKDWLLQTLPDRHLPIGTSGSQKPRDEGMPGFCPNLHSLCFGKGSFYSPSLGSQVLRDWDREFPSLHAGGSISLVLFKTLTWHLVSSKHFGTRHCCIDLMPAMLCKTTESL